MPAGVARGGGRFVRHKHDGMLPDGALGDLEHFVTIAPADIRFAPTTTRSISSPEGGMRSNEYPSLGGYSRTAPPIPRAGRSKVPLYPYQAEGALFAVRAGRALIGDEMGLGKTIQAIAATEVWHGISVSQKYWWSARPR